MTKDTKRQKKRAEQKTSRDAQSLSPTLVVQQPLPWLQDPAVRERPTASVATLQQRQKQQEEAENPL